MTKTDINEALAALGRHIRQHPRWWGAVAALLLCLVVAQAYKARYVQNADPCARAVLIVECRALRGG